MISGLGHVGCAVSFWIGWAFPAQRNMRKVGPAGCWLAHKTASLGKTDTYQSHMVGLLREAKP